MNAIGNLFVRAKHWQIFLGFIALVCAAVAAMLSSLLASPQEAFNHLFPFFAVMEIFAISFALWIWFLGAFLSSVVPSHLRMKMAFFRVAVIYVPLYLPILDTFLQIQTETRNLSLVLISWAVVFPLHLFAMFCQIYSWYFVSKSLALAESLRPASIADYLGYFVGIWILPVGIWIIQPRINRLYAATLSPQTA